MFALVMAGTIIVAIMVQCPSCAGNVPFRMKICRRIRYAELWDGFWGLRFLVGFTGDCSPMQLSEDTACRLS